MVPGEQNSPDAQLVQFLNCLGAVRLDLVRHGDNAQGFPVQRKVERGLALVSKLLPLFRQRPGVNAPLHKELQRAAQQQLSVQRSADPVAGESGEIGYIPQRQAI